MPRPRINYAKAGGHGDMRTHKIAAMGGDGIGPEVVRAGVQVLKVCAERDGRFTLDFQDFDWGSDYYRTHGVMMPADGADQLRKFDAILFGAVGSPDIPDHITLWGLRLAICQALDQYANVRPTRILPGITSPLRHVSGPELDWVIVRENSEGEYSGVGGRATKGTRKRSERKSRSSPASASQGSCATRSSWLDPAHASCSPSSRSRMRNATAW